MAVVKSPNDPRDYRVIHLDNGLTALLISDTNTVSSKQQHSSFTSIISDNESDDNSDDEQDSHDEDDASDDDDDDDDAMNTDGQENDDDNDHHESKKVKKDAKLAAAALCIGVGSFSDPQDIPGLAHFLEHMVFMGSKKYPEENDFDAFINKHGGSSNAATDCERTVFVFDIRRKYFKEALDRFAQFFIEPLMKEESVDREIQAVESEFMQSYQSDTVKKLQLVQSLARDGHPLKKFLWGSKETLKTVPAQMGIDVQGHLRNFQKRMYSSHYMTLAVCSKESLDELEELVKECFTDIPNNGKPVPTFKDCPEPFNDSLFCKLYKVIPVKDFHQVEITWMLPCQFDNYRIKPMHYISWLIGHEGPGSVLSLLIKKSWAVSLMCGNGETGIEYCSNYAMFPVMVILTDDGMEHIFEILTIIFQYLEMLRKVGPQERIYKEIQTIENNEFRFQEQCEPYAFTEHVVENMQLYPVEDFLTGDQLMWEYNPQVISEVLDQLVPHKANIMVSSKNFQEDECDEVEKWFQTNYKSTDIDPSWLESWKNIQVNPELHLPAENTYIATDFEIKDRDNPSPQYPVVILESQLGKLWHRRDNKFHTPRARYYFHLISPKVNVSPKSMVLTEIFLKVLEYNLKEISYSADVAQLSYSMSVHERGIVLKLDGFNHKLPLLFETIVQHFVNFEVSEQIFDVVKEQLSRSYRNTIIKPSRLIRSVRLAILQLVKWTMVEKEGAIDDITIDDLKNFAATFKNELYFESLIQGNVTVDEAISLQQHLYKMVNPAPLLQSFHPEVRVLELPSSETVCRIPCFNKDDANSIVTDYYQSGPGSVEDYAMMELLVMKMEEPCFDILRTREQLGYSVYCTCRNTFGVLGFSVTVQTQADKFSVDHVQGRIDAFLEEFRGILVKMKQGDFKSQVDALIEIKQHEDLNLADEANRNWFEILDHTYLFDRKDREIEVLQKITKDDIITCFRRHTKNGDKFKKLSVQIAGSGDSSTPTVNGIPSDKEDGSEQWVLRPTFVENKTCITDIAQFKQTRPVFPVSKII